MLEDYRNRFAASEVRPNRDNPEGRICSHLVPRALGDFLTPADTVLDIGGGPVRFGHEATSLVRSVEHLDYAQAMPDLVIAEGTRHGLRNVT